MADSNTQIQMTLARSYLAYFVASMLGLFADNIINLEFSIPWVLPVAIVCLGLGPALIFWAQYTSKADVKGEHHSYFLHGPYRYMRNPTHLGILILVTGYALISGSTIFFLVTLIGYLVSNIFFKKYERVLGDIHGEHYQTYKASVKRI